MIREANIKDISALLAIENESFDENSFVMSRMNFLYHIGRNPIFVEEKDGAIAGYILFFVRDYARVVRIYSIAVKYSFRGQNIASNLIAKAIEYAKTHKKESLKLEVRADNKAAIGLYKKLGFIAEKKRLKAYYPDKTSAIVMRKSLI